MRILTKLTLVIFGGFFATLVIFLFLIRPNLNSVSELYNAAVAKQTKLQSLTQQIEAYKKSQSDLDSIQNKDKILGSILERESLQDAIQQIEAAAAASGVSEGMTIQESAPNASGQSAVPDVITGKAAVTEVPYSITMTGQFASIVKFLQYMEHLPHFTEVSKFSFGAGNSTSSTADNSGLVKHDGILSGGFNAVFFIKKSKP
ncbi:MAG: hypothetical protein ABI643_03260 [Candidatus Doudnabacteria bacterium]